MIVIDGLLEDACLRCQSIETVIKKLHFWVAISKIDYLIYGK